MDYAITTSQDVQQQVGNKVYIREGHIFVEYRFDWCYVNALRPLKDQCKDWSFKTHGSTGCRSYPVQYAPLVQRALAPFAKDFTWPEELPALPFPETVPGIVLRRRQVPHEIRDNEGLTDEQIRAVCPAAFAEKADDSRSGAYLFIPTSQIIGGLREVGSMP